ncbi:hypothetical protein DSO57_1018900 [Entomophthora muscae]|uniref:Uncharacterized protein n=1 Tax=Entomophthora muscae TaxID=34485 RepID=A0ACC2TRI6_9FUNG|nr:hypothetical protein DSO57_1018900 [Entomophthora muscae]
MCWSSLDHYNQCTWACCNLVIATIWCELDTGLAIGSRQRRGNVSADTVEEEKVYVPHQTKTVAISKCVTCSSGQHHAHRSKRISVEVPSRCIPQTETKDISDHDLTSKEEEEEDKENNEAEEGSPSVNLDQ